MRNDQRKRKPSRLFEIREDAPWRPVVTLADGGTWTVDADGDDFYVVVDDIEEGMVTLDVAGWPHLDEQGRLAFTDLGTDRGIALSALHEIVTASRKAAGQPAPTRPIRVGDTFWVKGPDWPDAELAKRKPIDITAPARSEAKATHYAAVAPAVTPPEAQRMQLVPEAEEDESPTRRRGIAQRAMPEV